MNQPIFTRDDYLNLLEKSDPRIRNWAVEHLIEYYPKEIDYNKLMAAISGPTEALLIDAISQNEVKDMGPALLKMFKDKQGLIAARTAAAIGKLNIDGAKECLKNRLAEIKPDETILITGILEGLAFLGEKESILQYYKGLSEPKQKVIPVLASIFQHNPTAGEIGLLLDDLFKIPPEEFPSLFISITAIAGGVNDLFSAIGNQGIEKAFTHFQKDLGIDINKIFSEEKIKKYNELWEAEDYIPIIESIPCEAVPQDKPLIEKECAFFLIDYFKKNIECIKKLDREIQQGFTLLVLAMSVKTCGDKIDPGDINALCEKDISEIFKKGGKIEKEEALIERLGSLPLGLQYAKELIYIVDKPWAQRRAIRVMGNTKNPECIKPLIEFLNNQYLLPHVLYALSQIGEPVIEHIKPLIEEGHPTSMYLCRMLGGIPYQNTVNVVEEHFENLHANFRDMFLQAVFRLGSPKFLDKMRQIYRQGEPFEADTLLFLLSLHNPEDKSIPELEKELNSDTSQRIFMLHNESFGKILKGGPVPAEFRCLVCGHIFHHEFPRIYIHTEAGTVEETLEKLAFFPESVACKYCSARDLYVYTPITLKLISAAILNMMFVRRQKELPQEFWEKFPIRFLDFQNPDGEIGPPQYWIREYITRLTEDPENAKIYHRLGSAFLGLSRINEALSSYVRSIELDPDNLEGYIALSDIFMGMKNNKEARDWLVRGQSFFKTGKCYDSDLKTVKKEYETRLERLKDTPELPPAQHVRRNAPCPCGSGKKYKHCCGKAK